MGVNTDREEHCLYLCFLHPCLQNYWQFFIMLARKCLRIIS